MNPQTPKLYSLVKLHKKDYPIRPVVSFTSAPSYKLSKKLIEIINENTNFVAKFQIKNSYDLINKIQNIQLPNKTKLISFDVTNLFPNIPPQDTITLVEQLLNANHINYIKKQEILITLKTCLTQNYFEFNNTIYTNNKGLIMGNPLSPLLSEIFMNFIESKISEHSLFKKFIYWYRYVDDVLACFTGTDRQLKIFCEYINNLHANIKFTTEEETNNSINFLDLTITKYNNKHTFSIYHKPSHTDTTIHNKSCHPVQHKLAAFHSMIHRLLSIPLNEKDFLKELNIIKQIAVNNGYNVDIVNSILNKKKYKKALELIFPRQQKNNQERYSVITYIGETSNKIGSVLTKKLNINVAFKTNNTLSKHIKNNKSKTDKEQKSGVYKLNCENCECTYIGQTGRNFKKRIKEHFTSFITEKSDSNYANHLIESEHQFNKNFEILHMEKKGYKLNLLESLEINKLKNTNYLLNDQLELNSSPLLNIFQ